MISVMNERQLTEDQKEQLELEKIAPQKFDPEIEFPIQKKIAGDFKEGKYKSLSLQETQALLAKSDNVVMPVEKPAQKVNYPIMPRELAERMVKEHYEYKENERKKKCDSSKTKEPTPAAVTKLTKPTKISRR